MVRSIASALAHCGIEIHIATTDDNGLGRLAARYGVPVVDDGVTYWFFRRTSRFYTFSFALSGWLAAHVADYDLVHVHALFSHAPIWAALCAWRSEVPYIVRPLGTLNRWGIQNRRRDLKKLSFQLIERGVLGRAAAVHYTSEKERIEASEFGFRCRAEIIPNAIEPQGHIPERGAFRRRFPQIAGRRVVLFLSRFDQKKGLDLLLPAFARVRVRVPDAVLVLAGSGDAAFVRQLEGECTRLGLGESVLWPGFLTGADKLAALVDADVFVLPSYSENFGIAVIEAMQIALPVVISDQVAIHQEVTMARAGIVTPWDRGPLAEAVVRLLQDPQLGRELGRNGRALVEDRYSMHAVTSRLIELYEDVATQHARVIQTPQVTRVEL